MHITGPDKLVVLCNWRNKKRCLAAIEDAYHVADLYVLRNKANIAVCRHKVASEAPGRPESHIYVAEEWAQGCVIIDEAKIVVIGTAKVSSLLIGT